MNEATMVDSAEMIRPTYIKVYLDHITHNFQQLKQHIAPAKMMCILKANAYGHGMVRVAQHCEQIGADYLGVALLEEGLMLRQAGLTCPILVMGGILGDQIPQFIANDLTLPASSVLKLEQIEQAAAAMGRKARVHLLVDTGMGRIGIQYYSAERLLAASLTCQHCAIEGIFSHFANSDTADLDHAKLQLERFNEVLDFYERRSLPTPLRHLANAGAVLQMPEATFDMVRPGIALYGIQPSDEVAPTLDLKPTLSWHTHVVYFKVLKPGHAVSYGSTWTADEMTRVVTLPIGYGDGYTRRMSGQAEVILHGKRYPVIGRICMDQLMVDIGWDSAYNGDEAVLLGASDGATVTIEEMAAWAGTNVYEVLTSINTRVSRIYVGSNQQSVIGAQ